MYIAHKTCISCDNTHFVLRKFFDQVRVMKNSFLSDGQITTHIIKTNKYHSSQIIQLKKDHDTTWDSHQKVAESIRLKKNCVWRVLHTKYEKVYIVLSQSIIERIMDGVCNIHNNRGVYYTL